MKRLIVCADGTWNAPEKEGNKGGPSSSTNVLKMLRAINAVDGEGTHQVRFYFKGVGTKNRCDKVLGGMFGIGLNENVLDCYRFLANNYCPGDEIYIFGFSRGAFTARSLAGLIGALGLVHPRTLGKLPEGWKYYRMPPDQRDSREAKDCLDILGERLENIPIKCLGVWDTVGSLGIPVALLKNIGASRFRFHDVELGKLVENAFHAVAIDEARKAFAPTLWDVSDLAPGQNVRQVWFAGVHSNIGGGYADQGLSDIALDWMIQMVKNHTKLSFDDKYIQKNVRPRPDATLYNSRKGYWRILPKRGREIPPDGELHPSVDARRRAAVQPAYKPRNVRF